MSTDTPQPNQQAITVRVVLDGAADAGKTTALYALAQALSGVATTPGGEDGSTTYFDWMTYGGGQHEGRPVHVELATVPGGDAFIDRRNHLLRWADVIVFIADSSKSGISRSVAAFDQLQAGRGVNGYKPIVAVANKRDLDDAAPLETLRSKLALDGFTTLLEAVALSGVGIREAFICAVREALVSPAGRTETTSTQQLLADLQSLAPATEDHDEEVRNSFSKLVDVCLDPDGIESGGALVILEEHWRLIVEIASGRNEVPLTDGSPEAATAFELSTWGLITGTNTVVVVDEPQSSTDAITVDESVEVSTELTEVGC